MKTWEIQTPKRVIITGKSQISEGEIVKFGDADDYPTKIASLIENSQTAKSSARILQQFIASGFVDANVGKTEVGKTFTGKAYTLNKFLNDIAYCISKWGGAYVFTMKNALNQVTGVKVAKFDDCRFSAFDDTKFSNFVYYGDFSKSVKGKRNVNKAKKYAVFTDKKDTFEKQSIATGTTTQVYYIFMEDNYIYPLSPFDSCIFDMSSEYQISQNRNNDLVNGMSGKFILHVSKPDDPNEARKLQEQLQDWIGCSSTHMVVLNGDFDANGSLQTPFKMESIQDQRNANAFIDAEKSCANNIRKSCLGLPSVLIDYESGNLSNNSGEQMRFAYEYFARNTQDIRTLISESLSEIFENTTIHFAGKNFELKTPALE